MCFVHCCCGAAVANEVFNQCSEIVETSKDPDRPGKKEFRVKFDYEFLEDFQDESDLFSKISGLFKRYQLMFCFEILV